MRKGSKLMLLCASATVLWGTHLMATSRTAIGHTVENRKLPDVRGGEKDLLSKSVVHVLVFFRPGQDHSLVGLRDVARCEKELAGKPVRFVGLVSDRHPRAKVLEVLREAGPKMPVLVDAGDALFSALKVKVHPTAVIADKKHTVIAWQPFRKVNFCNALRARVLHALGLLSDKELQRALNPEPARKKSDDADLARRNLKLARALFNARKYEKAESFARKAVAQDGKVADAHALLGAALAAQGRCKPAVKAFDEALKLDKANAQALAGKKGCRGEGSAGSKKRAPGK